MHARVFPTIVMMDTEIGDRLIEDRVHLVILHQPSDAFYAQILIERMRSLHGPRLGGLAWQAEPIAYGTFDAQTPATAIYLFPAPPLTIIQSAQLATRRGLVSFGYEETSGENGVMASLFVGRSSTPWLNIETIRQSGIIFKPTLIQISRRYP